MNIRIGEKEGLGRQALERGLSTLGPQAFGRICVWTLVCELLGHAMQKFGSMLHVLQGRDSIKLPEFQRVFNAGRLRGL